MHWSVIRSIAFGAALLTIAAAASAQGACDRVCLKGFLDQYLAALERRDYRVDMLDPETGGALTMTAFEEFGGVAQMMVRLKIRAVTIDLPRGASTGWQ